MTAPETPAAPVADPKTVLLRYLNSARDALLWKLDGLSEYDIRRPLTRTGTNLLGLVKHVAGIQAEYFGAVFGRPFPEDLPWTAEDAEPNADMWATAEESRAEITALYERVRAHADATVTALPLDAVGHVPWWRDDPLAVTLHRVLVHVTGEINRHAGHADIVRELIDGAAGLRAGAANLPAGGADWWAAYRERLEGTARAAGRD